MENFVINEARAYFSKRAVDVMAEIGGSPKVATGIAAGMAGMGTMATLDWLQSTLGIASLMIGVLTGCVVLAIQTIKLMREYRAFKALSGFAIQKKGTNDN